MSFPKIIKTNHTRYLSKTWQDQISARVIERNNYQATGNLKEAKTFTNSISHLPIRQIEVPNKIEQHLIFSRDMIEDPFDFVFD